MPLRPDLPPLPEQMKHLPIDEERGYPVPWFVLWIDGKPEFRIVNTNAREIAWALKLCWVCGGELKSKKQTFVIGPMCAISRTTAEPGCHKECALYSAKACPFITKSQMTRRENDRPEGACSPAGVMILRNPGAYCLWTSDTADTFDDGDGGWLINIGEPVETPLWFSEGREATAAEVSESVRTGLPALEEIAIGTNSRFKLEVAIQSALKYMPAGVVV